MNFSDIFGKQLLFLDGGLGTMLQKAGLIAGELPEKWNITNPDKVQFIHEQYLSAGSNIIMSNTFGANSLKFDKEPFNLNAIVESGVKLALNAAEKYSTVDKPCFAALDIGPTGKLLKPTGTLDFEDCVEIFSKTVRAGVSAGAQLIIIETMNDTLEAKAAVLAAKENSELPILVSMTFDESGRLLSGADVKCAVALLEGLRVDAIGINCGLGPVQMKELVKSLVDLTSLPVIVCPNAGLPIGDCCGEAVYDVSADEFATVMCEIAEMGVWAIGGCCGTTPEHIKKTTALCKDMLPKLFIKSEKTLVTGFANAVEIGTAPIVIGERINPTGKKRLKQALLENDFDYILSEGIEQQKCGADVLDVNVGMPEIDEADMLCRAVQALQSVTPLPLQLDSASPKALERAMRSYNGKPLVNSVNGKSESMSAVFPLVKKYGGVVVGLTLDESGIPETAQGRVNIAKKIIETAKSYGIDKKDIIIDTLTMTVSTGSENAKITLEALKHIKALGVNTVLGASNVSFGLPCREHVNTAFLSMAIMSGLSAAIINPCSDAVMAAFKASTALCGFDEGCAEYTSRYSSATPLEPKASGEQSLESAVENGMAKNAASAAKELLNKGFLAIEIIENKLMPALNKVGQGFEDKTLFLPQLLMSAEAASAAFEVIRAEILRSGLKEESGEPFVLATVQGDIHDIGKNIVKVLLQNYGFKVIDLGKDVSPEVIVKSVMDNSAKLCGLSALMTTTVGAMEKTISLLSEKAPHCRVVVGGAVLTKSYAEKIRSDYYAKTAMDTVRWALSEAQARK